VEAGKVGYEVVLSIENYSQSPGALGSQR